MQTVEDIPEVFRNHPEVRQAAEKGDFDQAVYIMNEISGRLRRLRLERGSRYADCLLDNFECTSDRQRFALSQVRRFSASIRQKIDEGVNLLLIGPSGVGKDHLVAGLFPAACYAYKTLKWTTGANMFSAFRDAMTYHAPEAETFKQFTDPDVLIISDPAGTALTTHQAALLYEVIDQRYSNRRATWCTINARSREEADERLGRPIVDRLVDNAVIVVCDWPSYRKAVKS